MGKFFLKKIFTSHVHIQNDQRVMGIILRYVCWGTHRPPPGGPAADRPTRRPPRFGSTKGGGGVPPPPPLQPPKLSNTPRGHTLAGASPRDWEKLDKYVPIHKPSDVCSNEVPALVEGDHNGSDSHSE